MIYTIKSAKNLAQAQVPLEFFGHTMQKSKGKGCKSCRAADADILGLVSSSKAGIAAPSFNAMKRRFEKKNPPDS